MNMCAQKQIGKQTNLTDWSLTDSSWQLAKPEQTDREKLDKRKKETEEEE